MRKLSLFALVLLLASAPTALATDLVYSSTANEDTRLERTRVKENKATCALYSLPGTCTQGQARDAYCQLSYHTQSPCSGSTDVRIYGTVADYWNKVAKDTLLTLKKNQDTEDQAMWAAWVVQATQTQKDAMCAAVPAPVGPLPAGCLDGTVSAPAGNRLEFVTK